MYSYITDVSKPTVLYATLNAGASPIIGASVMAHVTTTLGEIVEIELWDNGAGKAILLSEAE